METVEARIEVNGIKYEIRTRRLPKEETGGKEISVKGAYTPDGKYIGTPEFALELIVRRGIAPEVRPGCCSAKVCSIGFCEREQKWYGWSHRAIRGFGIGDVVEKGDIITKSGWTDTYLSEHPECDLSFPVGFVAQTLEDCKRMAIAFAEAVA